MLAIEASLVGVDMLNSSNFFTIVAVRCMVAKDSYLFSHYSIVVIIPACHTDAPSLIHGNDAKNLLWNLYASIHVHTQVIMNEHHSHEDCV